MPSNTPIYADLVTLQKQLLINLQYFIGYLETHLEIRQLPDFNSNAIIAERDGVAHSFQGEIYERNQIIYLQTLREQNLNDLGSLLAFIDIEHDAYEQYFKLNDTELSDLFKAPHNIASPYFSTKNNLNIDFGLGADYRYNLTEFFRLHYKITLLMDWIQKSESINEDEEILIHQCYEKLNIKIAVIKTQLDSPTDRVTLFNRHKVDRNQPVTQPIIEDPTVRDADATAATEAYLLEQGYIAAPPNPNDTFAAARDQLQAARHRIAADDVFRDVNQNPSRRLSPFKRLIKFIWGRENYYLMYAGIKTLGPLIKRIKLHMRRIWSGGPVRKVVNSYLELFYIGIIFSVFGILTILMGILCAPLLRPGKHLFDIRKRFSRPTRMLLLLASSINYILVLGSFSLLITVIFTLKLLLIAFIINVLLVVQVFALLLAIRLAGYIRNCIWPRTDDELIALENAENLRDSVLRTNPLQLQLDNAIAEARILREHFGGLVRALQNIGNLAPEPVVRAGEDENTVHGEPAEAPGEAQAQQEQDPAELDQMYSSPLRPIATAQIEGVDAHREPEPDTLSETPSASR